MMEKRVQIVKLLAPHSHTLMLGKRRTVKKNQANENKISAYSTHKDDLSSKTWLATSMDPICETDQNGSNYLQNIHQLCHEHKNYVEPLEIHATRNISPT